MAITLRRVTPEDEAFLFEVFAAARLAELVHVPWNDDQKRHFLRFQFEAQHQDYHRRFAEADFLVVLVEAVPVGRLYVDRRSDEIRILDGSILSAYRGQGIGTHLLRTLLAEAESVGKPVRIFVEHYQHEARRLLLRLGFVDREDHGVSILMEHVPGSRR